MVEGFRDLLNPEERRLLLLGALIKHYEAHAPLGWAYDECAGGILIKSGFGRNLCDVAKLLTHDPYGHDKIGYARNFADESAMTYVRDLRMRQNQANVLGMLNRLVDNPFRVVWRNEPIRG